MKISHFLKVNNISMQIHSTLHKVLQSVQVLETGIWCLKSLPARTGNALCYYYMKWIPLKTDTYEVLKVPKS